MKKIVACIMSLIVAVSIVLCVTGCGKEEEQVDYSTGKMEYQLPFEWEKGVEHEFSSTTITTYVKDDLTLSFSYTDLDAGVLYHIHESAEEIIEPYKNEETNGDFKYSNYKELAPVLIDGYKATHFTSQSDTVNPELNNITEYDESFVCDVNHGIVHISLSSREKDKLEKLPVKTMKKILSTVSIENE